MENYPIPMQRIGVRRQFAESGPYLEVIDKYGLTTPHIVEAVKEGAQAQAGRPGRVAGQTGI